MTNSTTFTTPCSIPSQVSDPGKTLQLADNFQPDVDLLVSEGLIAFGVKGSGKSNLVARIAEQLGRFFLPQIILDTEREYHSLVNLLPHGIIATANRCPSGFDVLHKGLQVVVDLRSWATDEAAALAVVQLVGELFTTAMSQAPQERVPCIVHLDEAGYWIPQDAVPYLSKSTRIAIADAFHKLAARGRKMGLVPFLYTQSISEVGKSSIRQAGVKVLMRQTLDIDLNRYAEYIHNATPRTKKAIQAFPTGKAIVILPDGSQRAVQFYERVSTHPSHTPRTQAALAKFADTTLDLAALSMRDMTATISAEPVQKHTRRTQQEPQHSPSGKTKHAPSIRERIFTLLKRDQFYTSKQLAAIVGCPPNTAQIYRKAYFERTPQRQSKQEQRIRALLAENPTYTLSQLARRANCSYRDAKRLVERLQSQSHETEK